MTGFSLSLTLRVCSLSGTSILLLSGCVLPAAAHSRPESAPQRDHTLRDVIEGLRYLVRTGAPWRYLPGDFPHRATEEKPWQGGRRLLAVAAQAVELDPVRLEAIAGG